MQLSLPLGVYAWLTLFFLQILRRYITAKFGPTSRMLRTVSPFCEEMLGKEGRSSRTSGLHTPLLGRMWGLPFFLTKGRASTNASSTVRKAPQRGKYELEIHGVGIEQGVKQRCTQQSVRRCQFQHVAKLVYMTMSFT